MKALRNKVLGDICTIIDCEHKTAPTQESGIPLIRTPNVGRGVLLLNNVQYISDRIYALWSRRALPRAGDLIMAREAPVGNVAIIPIDAKVCLGQRTVLIRVKDRSVNASYLNYLLNSPAMNAYLRLLANGATVGHLNVSDIRRLALPLLPSEKVQNKIAAILSAYDDLIENNKRRIALLEKMAEEIYREWFVRMRFPGHERTKFVKGVPEGWERRKFGDFCNLKRGYDLPDTQVDAGPFPVIASTSVKTFHSKFKVEPPVITTGRSGSLGKVLLINARAWPLNTTLYVQDLCGNSPFLIFYTLKNMKLENFNAGAGVPTLNRNHLNGIPMAVPAKSLQDRFDGLISSTYALKENFTKAQDSLTRSRNLLLPRLISGKLSVEDLDIQFRPSMREEAEMEAPVP